MDHQLVVGMINRLKERMYRNERELDGLFYRKAEYTAPGVYRYLTDWQPVTRLELFNGSNTVLIRGSVRFPEEIRSDEDFEDCLFLSIQNLAGTVYVDGEPYHGIDANRSRIPLRKEWAGQTKELLIEGYSLGEGYDRRNAPPIRLSCACFRRADRKIEQYLHDLRLARDWYENCGSGPGDEDLDVRKKPASGEDVILRKRITAAYEASVRELDVSLEGDAFRDAVIRADEVFRARLAAIDDGDVRSHVSLVASTHIDVAWLWQLRDTVRKCSHTYSNMLRLLDSYPDFRFSNSQVLLMAYTKQYYPALFEQIKAAEKAGRWENVGPMWVESDCNVISGESVVRQILHGTAFLEKEFGSRPRVAWLPDTFGFQPNLPQIFKKSGTDYFFSFKLHWQASEPFPYGDFRWKGIDGSEILCAVTNNPMRGYNGFPSPADLRVVTDAFDQRGETDEILFPYGYGDGGGGPIREMIEYARRLEDYPGLPRCEISTAQEFFDRLETQRDALPVWYGELYIQTHRGTLTSVSDCKKNNRRAEMLYQSLEKLAVMAEACGAKPDWALLRKGWESILTLQFHDILPGSSIAAVYDDCREMYREVFAAAARFLEGLGLAAQPVPGGSFRVVNTLSWPRDVLASVRFPAGESSGKTARVTVGGAVMPSSVVRRDDAVEVIFLAKNVPPMSCAECTVEFTGEAAPGRTMRIDRTADGVTVENDRYLAEIDGDGRIASLMDKRAGRQVLSAPGNDVRLFLDGPSIEDAWNIEELYKTRETGVFTDSRVEAIENSDLRAVIRVTRTGERTSLEQEIVFYHDKPRIDFRTRVNWQEKNKMMRVYFPTAMNAPAFTSEVGFGAYSRPTLGNTKFEKAKFEVAAHRWTDISENNYGVALMNDCRYGHDVQYNTIGLTLLRSTSFPAEYPDLGVHEFTYSLLPHEESWSRAGVARAGVELNAEAHAVSVIGSGAVAEGLFSCACPDLIIDSVKPAEDGEGVIVRLYESNGNSGRAALLCGRPFRSACECDLTEKKIADADCDGAGIRFSFTPYEIKTFRIVF